MALVIASLSGIFSGKVGGMVFQRNGRVRTHFYPGGAPTAQQLDARVAFAAVSSEWLALTEVLRDTWQEYAGTLTIPNRIGSQISLTGKSWYEKFNVQRSKAGLTSIAIPPSAGQIMQTQSPSNQTEMIVDTPETGASIIGLTFSPGLAAGTTLAYYVASPRSVSSRKTKTDFAYRGFVNGAATPVVAGNITMPVAMVEGNVYDIRIFRHSTTTLDTTRYDLTATVAA